ncbi:hypothetical protein EV356DRAFT_71439 [Viridothelium virens]|uniref:Uncharacterized protein n=1 Tax=Viridothelium virens TaxID=1048519 RepID=A0A6A6HFY4_VIRVR|nr:hypothetical protein EV356DRAFT_71439 [Viridothelium virens]
MHLFSQSLQSRSRLGQHYRSLSPPKTGHESGPQALCGRQATPLTLSRRLGWSTWLSSLSAFVFVYFVAVHDRETSGCLKRSINVGPINALSSVQRHHMWRLWLSG